MRNECRTTNSRDEEANRENNGGVMGENGRVCYSMWTMQQKARRAHKWERCDSLWWLSETGTTGNLPKGNWLEGSVGTTRRENSRELQFSDD
jgi:hypothetical protein